MARGTVSKCINTVVERIPYPKNKIMDDKIY